MTDEDGVADREDAAVDRMQPPGGDTPDDAAVGEAESSELPPGDDPY